MSEHHDPSVPTPRSRRRLFVVAAVLAAVAFVSAGGGAVWASHQFSDVPTSHPFHDDIDWMADFDITDGFSDGTYRPGQPVTRQAMAAFMRRLSGEFEMVADTEVYSSATVVIAQVSCPAGKRPLAGGGNTTSTDIFLTSSNPTLTNGWSVRWETDNNVTRSGTAAVFALCAPRL